MPSDPNIGRVLQNRYQLVGLLGQGSMGKVYEAKNNLLGGVPVAIKFLSQTLLNQRMRDRFMREATTCALLGQRSIHIVNVTDYGVDEDEIPYYVMEYLKGDSLSEIIMRQPLLLPRFLNLTRQICLGLQCAHQGIPVDGEFCPIVHRDIKPSNILITRDPSMGEVAKILDFGIAKTLQADSNQTNCFMGTLAYSSPEQMEGHELDARSDIYSLGVMMFQMLTGKMPLNADTHSFGGWYRAHHHQQPRSLIAANSGLRVPKALESLIMSCLAKSPGDRPQNANEVIAALKPLEERYGAGLDFAKVIEDTLAKVPVASKKRTLTGVDAACQLVSWPANKPIGDISFPNPIRTEKETLASLWVMLSDQEITSRRTCTRYNQFLFAPAPHPSLLWLTVLYNRQAGARWLSCYLDLKTPQGQQMARLLSESGQYRLLFFAKEEPQRCAHVMTSTIALAQCERLKQWLTMGQMTPGLNQFNATKTQLKLALEDLKPKILMKLESLYDDGGDLSG
ncbi:MAG: serine/threonine-protein kinase [Cyanobacteria bacterium J069]|nr:MAG: serine/threonine protein kinase [Cyanobacteria bacterium J069]